jgi:F-type H+-transporting ATPase subunit a
MVIAVILATAVFVWGMRQRALVPGRLQSVAEVGYEFVAGMVRDNVGDGGKKYFPFILTLFIFILFCNVLGMVPYSFTPTSHIVVTFAMAAFVFVGVTIIGFAKHGLHFFSFFVPKGVPFVLLLLLVPIEVLSYIIRPFTLSIRLFANMMAGHTMLAIFAGFVAPLLLAAGAIKAFAIVPLGVDILLIFLELLVAALQAYVFTILTCLYLRDAIHLH